MDERITDILKHPATIPSVVGVVSFGVGAGLGYILGRRHSHRVIEFHEVEKVDLDLKVDEIVHTPDGWTEADGRTVKKKTANVIRSLSDLKIDEIKLDPTATPGPNGEGEIIEVSEVDWEKVGDETPDEDEVSALVSEEVNVFAAPEDGWDYEEEVKKRNPVEPYVLHRDEFFGEDPNFDWVQTTCTYYQGDNILVDEQDVPIYNFQDVIGELKFGHGSGDPNVFYVRNPKLRGEYEVVLHTGHYSVEVEGLEIEDEAEAQDLSHANRPLRFRRE